MIYDVMRNRYTGHRAWMKDFRADFMFRYGWAPVPSTICAWFRADGVRPNANVIRQLAEFFNVSPDDLFPPE